MQRIKARKATARDPFNTITLRVCFPQIRHVVVKAMWDLIGVLREVLLKPSVDTCL